MPENPLGDPSPAKCSGLDPGFRRGCGLFITPGLYRANNARAASNSGSA
jgi:hypothetical protein